MRHIIGIDVGGTKIEGILINEEGKILNKIRIPTQADKGGNTVLNNIITVAKKVWADPVHGVGLGLPGPVTENGVIGYMANIKHIKNINIKKVLEKKLGVEVRVENDNNLFALAEHIFGAGKKYPNMMGIGFGTGIGAGIIINNQLYSGRHGSAGEIGHIIVDAKKLRDLEYFAGGPGILRLYHDAGGKTTAIDTVDVFKAKDAIAKAVVEKIHELIAQSLAQAINLLNIELIVVHGGVSHSLNLRLLNNLTRKFVFSPLKKTFRIVPRKLGDSAGSLGAAALFFD